jgi:hypothetical protein
MSTLSNQKSIKNSHVPVKYSEREVEDNMLVELVEALQAIDENDPLASENAVSIASNDGDRILL